MAARRELWQRRNWLRAGSNAIVTGVTTAWVAGRERRAARDARVVEDLLLVGSSVGAEVSRRRLLFDRKVRLPPIFHRSKLCDWPHIK